MSKKFLCILISLLMLLPTLSINVFAENNNDSQPNTQNSSDSENSSDDNTSDESDSDVSTEIPQDKAILEILTCNEGSTSIKVGIHEYPVGKQEIKLIPNAGHHVYGVEINGVFQELSEDTLTIDLESGKKTSLRPVFRGNLIFNIEQKPGGKLSPEGKVYFDSTKTFDITAVPDVGYICSAIYINNRPIDITKDGNVYRGTFKADIVAEYQVFALFSPAVTHVGTLTMNDGGKVMPFDEEGKVYVVDGDSKQFQVKPDDGYGIKSIKINDKDVSWGSDGVFTVENVTADFNVNVEFAPMESIPVKITTKGKGKVTQVTKAYKNSKVVLDITPDKDNEIVSIKVNGNVEIINKDGKLEISITEEIFSSGSLNINIVFDAVAEKHIIRTIVQNSIGGVITADGYIIENMRTEVRDGGSITLTFTPHMNYVLDKVKVDGIIVQLTEENKFTLNNVKETHTINAYFILNVSDDETLYKVNVKTSSGGKVEPETEQTVKSGQDITFTFTPDNGYSLDYILLNGEKKEVSDNTFTIKNVIVDYNLEVFFKKNQEITSDDINWNDSKITIDISNNAYITNTLFNNIKENANNKEVVFKGNDYSWNFPASFNYPNFDCDLTILRGKNNFPATIISALEEKMMQSNIQGLEFEAIKTSGANLGDNVTLTVFLGSNFAGKELDYLFFDPNTGKFNSVIEEINSRSNENKFTSTKIKVGADGNVNIPYNGKEFYILVVSASSKYTLNLIAGINGSISPRGTMKVPINSDQTIQISPDPGYMVEKITVNGTTMYQEYVGKTSSFSIVLGKINNDYTIEVSFVEASNQDTSNGVSSDNVENGGTKPWVVAIIIIGIAIAGSVALFIYKWNEEKDIVD